MTKAEQELSIEVKRAYEHVDHLTDEISHADDFNEVKKIEHRLDIAKSYASGLQRAQHFMARYDVSHTQEVERVDRFEVIDDTGRAYVKGSIYGTPVSIKLSHQDDGRTLKVFVSDRQEKK